MDWFEAAILGIVEGLTEYLPVSSTGHLLVTQRLLGIEEGAAANAYAIAIQAGAILAVLGLYRQRVLQIFRGFAGRDTEGRLLGVAIVVAFLPAAILGPLLDASIEEHLFGLVPILVAWFLGGVAILATSAWKRRRGGGEREGQSLAELRWKGALCIGLLQCLAMWPGTSRSLVTIVGGLLVGLRLSAAVEFSFLLGLLTLGAATGYKAVFGGVAMLESYGAMSLVIGFVTAWVAALVSVRWMLHWLQRHGLELFGYYRIGLALLVGAWFLALGRG